LFAQFVPGQAQLLVDRGDRITLLPLGDRQERTLLDVPQRLPLRLRLAPDGRQALVEGPDALTWQQIDLASGAARPLDALKGLRPLFKNLSDRWIMFVDNTEFRGTHHYLSLDLETGATQAIGDLSGLGSPFPFHATPDGSASLVVLQPEQSQQLWLLRAAGGAPRKLAEAPAVSGVFSPDGRQVLISSLQGSQGARSAQLQLVDIESDTTKNLGEGWSALWLRP
jgi:hypothetical protein